MYASLGRRLFEATDTDHALEIIRELKQKLRERVPSLNEVKALFPEIIYTDRLSKDRGLVKYILTAFDKRSLSGVAPDFDSMTIEHLIPQSQIDTGDLTEAVIGQLGNLILVSPEMNNKLGDKPFKEKRRILEAGNYPLPREIASATDWTWQDIRKRTDRMAQEGYSIVWKI